MKRITLLLITISSALISCEYNNLEKMYPAVEECDTDTTAVTYTKDIQAILTKNCGLDNSCHQTNGSTSEIPLTSYADVQNVVVTGQLVSSVTHDGNAADMPKSLPKLEECELNKIIAWVNQGSLE